MRKRLLIAAMAVILLVTLGQRATAKTKMGSYAWVVSGQKTASGNPIIYSGPQMGFSVPSSGPM